MADGVSDDGNGDEPLVLPTPAGCTDVQSLITLILEDLRKNRQNRQEAQAQMKAQMKEELDQWQRMKTNRQEAEQAKMKATQDQQDQWQQQMNTLQQEADDMMKNCDRNSTRYSSRQR